MAIRVNDVLLECAELMSKELGWSDETLRSELKEVKSAFENARSLKKAL